MSALTLKDIALGWLTVADAGHVGLIEGAAECGFGSISLKLLPAAGDPVPPVIGDPVMIRDIRRALSGTGLPLLEMGGIWLRPDTRIADTLAGLDLGADLGAKYVVVVGGDPDRNRLQDNLSSLTEAADARGLGVAIEFVVYTEIKTIEDALAIALATGRPNCGVLVDALHLDRSGGTPKNLEGIPADRVFVGQLCDAPASKPPTMDALRYEGRSQRFSPGGGDLPLRDLLAKLPAGVPLEIEVPRADLAHLPPRQRLRVIAEETSAFLASGL